MRILKEKIGLIFLLLLRVLSYLIPKKTGMLVFEQWHNQNQFSGNIKALVLYTHKNYKNGDFYVISNSKGLYKEIEDCGIRVVNNKLLSCWYILRAEFFIIDATATRYAGWNLKIIQLWHGTGFKNIGLLNDSVVNDTERYLKFKMHYKQYRLVVAASENDQRRKISSFGVSNVAITGSPINDVFFKDKKYNDGLKVKYGIEEFDTIISYTPTFRDFETSPPFTEIFWSRLNDYLVSTNTLFIIKKHPWDKYLKVSTTYSNIKDLSSVFVDVQDLLLITDLLISDYSSIITDFAITNRPVLLYVYDLDVYKKTCRDFYYDINEILPQPFIFTQEELLNKIKSNSWQNEDEYVKSYTKFRNRFHHYFDGNSSERVLNEIIKLSSNSSRFN